MESPAPDIAQLAREVRVGLFPIHFGTGQLTKILEAAEAGCAIVASLSRDSARARALASAVRDAVEHNFAQEDMKRRLVSTLRAEGGAR